MAQSKPGGFFEVVRTIVIAVLIALVVRTFAYEPFNIPSGSMKPTLLVGDYLFVSKFSYGYSRFSLPAALPLFSGRILDSPVERGDVVVFRLPTDNSTIYVKRIVGLPGDRLQVRGGVLYINGAAVKRERIEDFVEIGPNGSRWRVPRYRETLPSGRQYEVLDANPNGSLDNTDVYNVPAGHYFGMGDNRDHSQDSRVLSAVGFIPEDNLVGRADMLFFSVEPDHQWWEIWKLPGAIRTSRLFDSIG